jgi:hypothetical protein
LKVKLKYPAKIGDTLLPKGTEGVVVDISQSPRIQQAFPGIMHNHQVSNMHIVRFPGQEDCLFEKKQLEYEVQT